MTDFNHTSRAVEKMSPRQRAVLGEWLAGCEHPLLMSLGYDVLAVQAIEDAHVAQFELEISEAHRAEMERISQNLPPIPRWSDASSPSIGLESREGE